MVKRCQSGVKMDEMGRGQRGVNVESMWSQNG